MNDRRYTKFIAGLGISLILLSMVGTSAMAAAGDITNAIANLSVSSGFCDNFNNSSLDPIWTWIDPLGDSSYSLTISPGFLRLYTPDGGHDLYPIANFNAPRLIQSIGGDFVVTTKVTINPAFNYQGTGLLIWQDVNNYIRLERTLVDGIDMWSRIGGVYSGIQILFSNPTVYLRLQRSGNTITGSYSENGLTWTTVTTSDLPAASTLQVGLVLINQWQDHPISSTFDFFEVNGGCTTFSISGQVMDGSNNGIADVSVSDGAGYTTTTDSSGNYTLSGLAAGTYTITPSKSGYTFSPASRSISLPPDAAGQNFTATQLPPIGKPLVVLVHGIMVPGSRQISCNEGITLNGDDDLFGNMPEWLNNLGYEVWSAHLNTGPDYTASLRSNANCLRDQIAQVRNRAPVRKVILIAHSMGGLVARAYMEDDGLYQNDVKTLITLGSPHQGVPVPWWDAVKSLVGLLKGWTCENQVAACEMTQGIEQFNQQHSIRRPDVEYYTVSGDLSFSDSRSWGRILRAVIPGADDGAVPQSSGNGLSGSRQTLATDEAHIKDFGLFSYFVPPPGDLYSFAYADCIQPVLAGNPDGCHATAAQSSAATAAPSFSALSPIVEGSLSSGQLIAHTLGMDGSGSALFAASWIGDTVTFTLESPSGQVIDPAYALAHPDQVNYLQSDAGQTPLGASYAITPAEAGVWTMNLLAGSVPAGSAYALLVAMESPITLTGQTDREWYTPGATATITTTLDGSPSSATITATILRADRATDTLTLSSIGNGQYQASYTVPAAPGYAEVRLVASGTTASSLSFERGTSLAFQISPNTFTLNNNYADTPSLYPSFSLYQFLNVTVGINTTINRSVGLSANLVDGSGNFVAHALTIQDVATDPTTLTLKFDGTDIFASRHNGPYTLTNILLTDETGATLATQQALAVYTTALYLYTNFASPSRIYLPLVMR